jgi:hypothetical protein
MSTSVSKLSKNFCLAAMRLPQTILQRWPAIEVSVRLFRGTVILLAPGASGRICNRESLILSSDLDDFGERIKPTGALQKELGQEISSVRGKGKMATRQRCQVRSEAGPIAVLGVPSWAIPWVHRFSEISS